MAPEIPHSLVRAVRDVPIFAGLGDDELLHIVGESANLFWRAQSTIFAADEEPEALYVVVSGRVAIIEDDQPIAEVAPGGYFGEQSLLAGARHSKTARALEDSELLVLPRAAFVALISDEPDLESEVRARLDDRIARTRGS